jgi:hypothetical protein
MIKLNVKELTDQELMDLIRSMQMRKDLSPERYCLFADELIRRGYQPVDQICLTVWGKR